MSGDEHRARRASAAARAAGALNVVGIAIEGLAGRGLPGVPLWPVILSAAVGLAVIAASFARPASRGTASLLFVINSAAISLALFVRDPYYARLAEEWTPFQGSKLCCIVVALLATELAAGVGAIVLHAGSSVLAWGLLEPQVRAHVAHGEPWIMIGYGLIAAAIFAHRLRREALERALFAAKSEAAAAQRIARTVLAIRHLGNTPVQTIALTSAILRRRCPEAAPHLDRQQRAVEELRRIDGLLARYDAKLEWRDEDLSLDATAELEERPSNAPTEP